MAMGAVTVKFNNGIPLQEDSSIKPSLTLSFHVDGAGNVTLDASAPTSSPTVSQAVDAWDGPVGTISYAGAFNTTFTMELSAQGGSGLRVSTIEPGGLGVGGMNASRIDNGGKEVIIATAVITTGQVSFSTINWNNRQKTPACAVLTGPVGAVKKQLDDDAGSWEVSAEKLKLGTGQTLIFGTLVTEGAKSSGYTLAGFTFDVVAGSGSGPWPLVVVGCL